MLFSVLLVDDEKMPREVLKNHLPWESLRIGRVDVAEDGLQALEMARQHRPDIVVSDVKMPRMNGLELAQEIRTLHPDCQLVFLSGYTDKEYLKGAIKLRAASYVEKPIDLAELTAVLQEVVNELEALQETDPRLLFYRGEKGDFAVPLNGQTYVYKKESFSELGNLIRHKQKRETMDLLDKIYSEIQQCEETAPEVIRNLYCQIVFSLLSAAENRNFTAVTQQGDYLLYKAAKQETLKLLWEALTSAMELYFDQAEEDAQDLVTLVDNYLERHFTDSTITGQAIALGLGFSHTYLCSAYKKGTGQTINQKLTELRLNLAKKLLADPSLKLYRVAHDVGYCDGKYFVKLFKKQIGITPKQYRENLSSDEQ